MSQLYHYRFARIDFGDDKGAYYHPDFQRHDKEKCLTVQRRSSEDQGDGSSQLERVPPSIMSMSALNPTPNVNDYKIALGTGAQVAAIEANRMQNFGLLQHPFGKQQDFSKLNPADFQKGMAAMNPNLHQLPNNPLQLSGKQPSQQQRLGEPNWLGAWLERQTGEQSQDSIDFDLEPRPIKDQQQQGPL